MNKLREKEFWRAAVIRAARTGAQVFIATVGATAKTMEEVEWTVVLSSTALAMLLSIINSVATGLPEVEE